MERINYLIDETEEGGRLDKILSEKSEDFSRARIQQLLDQGLILVNDEIKKNNYKVKRGDEITIDIPEVKELEAFPQDLNLDILYEDEDIIVVNKPKGMVVHPGAGNPDHTLVNGLLFHCKDLSGINGVLRPGIVHRIDKDTTGCIVACKNDKAHEAISKQLSNKTCSRDYIAIVHGELPHEYGTIDAPIGRDSKDRQKMTVTDKNGRDAVTHFKVEERFKGFTLVSFKLETGRTHQIRVHMQYIGYPIVGDPKYAFRNTRTDTEGQVLHAEALTLVHPTTNETMTFKAPLPDYFKALIEEMRGY
ncbi:RluA family pseudouridine synthase [Anaerorhabdus furcosa]|uniref:Pseudouridine synthase n=1 Tax=Anaerorhabdus furcosa TaxID=118967 RepID=A0A1T4QDR8_9FIRM|nr:RluA family pseudouridine synthase [Anaerorhabdus furcosa]SKA01824.1 23S rRNA pseudouridine1911/1915/1917 synthase [Anaerorhabdus furcosa]